MTDRQLHDETSDKRAWDVLGAVMDSGHFPPDQVDAMWSYIDGGITLADLQEALR